MSLECHPRMFLSGIKLDSRQKIAGMTHWIASSAFGLLAMTMVFHSVVFASEPYYITLQKLELKSAGAEWVDIIEPDHKVDLLSAEPSISFFNNGRVPGGAYDNYRVTFEDHGTVKQLSRKTDFEKPVVIKKGTFVNITFTFEWEEERPRGIQEALLIAEGDERLDTGDIMEIKE